MKKIDIAGIKWKGYCKIQEDSFGIYTLSKYEHIFVLADGIGGFTEGKTASQFAVDRTIDLYLSGDKNIKSVMDKINQEILNYSLNLRLKNRIGTTLIIGELILNKLKLYSVGDSSVYKINFENIEQLNKHQVIDGFLINYIGYDKFNVEEIDVLEIDLSFLKRNEWIFVCTDGVYKNIFLKTIQRILVENRDKSSENILCIILERLKLLNLEYRDNATMILLK